MRPIDADKLKDYLYTEPLYTDSINDRTDIREHIDRMPTVCAEAHEWIPCSDRMPDKEGWYLITVDEGGPKNYVETDYWSFCGCDFRWDDHFKSDVLAWMPAPKPYQK